MNDAMKHLGAKSDTKCPDYPDPKSIANNSQRNHEANQHYPPPRAPQEQVSGKKACNKEHPAGSDATAFLCDLNYDVRQLKDSPIAQNRSASNVKEEARGFSGSQL
jgi:hypothetical protein